MSETKKDLVSSFSLEQQFAIRYYLELSKKVSHVQLQQLFEEVLTLKIARDVLMRKLFKQEFTLDVPNVHQPTHIIDITEQTSYGQTTSD